MLCTGSNGVELGPEVGTRLKCPDYGGVLISEGVVLCTDFNGVELGPEVGTRLKCPDYGGVLIMEVSSFQRVLCYVQTSMELSWGLKMCPY